VKYNFEAAKYAQQNGYKVTCLVYSWQNKLVKLQPIIELGGDVFYIPNTGRSKKIFGKGYDMSGLPNCNK
jgi:hypothetical protein